MVAIALVVGLVVEQVGRSTDVVDTSSLEGFQPDEGGAPVAAPATPIIEREVISIPPRAKAVPLSGVWTYSVVVEKGMPDGDSFAGFVDRIIGDPRGWSRKVKFKRAGAGETPVFTVMLVAPSNVDRLCAPLKTEGTYSCGLDGRAVINALRWRDGPVETGREAWSNESLDAYRTMVVNHETGHVLGLGHQSCARPGSPSSIMAQQTIDLKGCQPNPWPLDEDLARLR